MPVRSIFYASLPSQRQISSNMTLIFHCLVEQSFELVYQSFFQQAAELIISSLILVHCSLPRHGVFRVTESSREAQKRNKLTDRPNDSQKGNFLHVPCFEFSFRISKSVSSNNCHAQGVIRGWTEMDRLTPVFYTLYLFICKNDVKTVLCAFQYLSLC